MLQNGGEKLEKSMLGAQISTQTNRSVPVASLDRKIPPPYTSYNVCRR